MMAPPITYEIDEPIGLANHNMIEAGHKIRHSNDNNFH